jgi:eukaryotic-like serine/threonine-protein kinase
MAKLLSPNQLLKNRYRIRSAIGQGGMGAIYLAEDQRLSGRMCAIKEVERDPILPANLQQEARDQFYREASILARLDHPNLPKVSDFFSSFGRDYLVMDYVPGKDLRLLLEEYKVQNIRLPEQDILLWASQLCDALEYLHGQNPPILHRDIKPGNIRIMANGLLKLVDFGLVKVMVPDEMTITVVQGRGTALYTPLEQYGGETGHTDVRSDVYSLSCTLYHLFTGSTPPEAKQRFLHPDSLESPRALNPDLSPEVERVLLWGMALHPDNRPESIHVFREALLGERDIRSFSFVPLRSATRNPLRPLIRLRPYDRWMIAGTGFLLLLAILRNFL